MENKYNVLISNTIIFAIGNFFVKIISVFLMPLYTSVMTAEQYGIAELLNNLNEIFLPLITLNIVDSLYRFSIDDEENKKELFTNALAIILIGYTLLLVVILIIGVERYYEYTYSLYLLCLSASLYKCTTQFVRGLGEAKKFVLYSITNSVVLILSNIIFLVYLNGGINSYILSIILGYGISTIMAFFLSKEYRFVSFKHFNLMKLKEMLSFSIPTIPNSISWWINNVSNRYLILFFLDSATAGFYAAASKLPSMVNTMAAVFQQAWQYSTAKEINSSDSKVFFTSVFNLYITFCVTSCLMIFLVNKIICDILLKSEFNIIWKFLPILMFAATMGCISTYFGSFYGAVKNNKLLMYSTLTGAGANISLNIILIPLLGIYGAAISSVVSSIIITVIRMIHVKTFIDMKYDYTKISLYFILTVFNTWVTCADISNSQYITLFSILLIFYINKEIIFKIKKHFNLKG